MKAVRTAWPCARFSAASRPAESAASSSAVRRRGAPASPIWLPMDRASGNAPGRNEPDAAPADEVTVDSGLALVEPSVLVAAEADPVVGAVASAGMIATGRNREVFGGSFTGAARSRAATDEYPATPRWTSSSTDQADNQLRSIRCIGATEGTSIGAATGLATGANGAGTGRWGNAVPGLVKMTAAPPGPTGRLVSATRLTVGDVAVAAVVASAGAAACVPATVGAATREMVAVAASDGCGAPAWSGSTGFAAAAAGRATMAPGFAVDASPGFAVDASPGLAVDENPGFAVDATAGLDVTVDTGFEGAADAAFAAGRAPAVELDGDVRLVGRDPWRVPPWGKSSSTMPGWSRARRGR